MRLDVPARPSRLCTHVPVKTPMTEHRTKHSAQIKIDLEPTYPSDISISKPVPRPFILEFA